MPMHHWRLDLQYDGTHFHGWARQPGLRTVQAEVERALATVLRERIRVRVAGRTDAGVHAWGQVASFVISSGRERIDPRRLLLALNALLPDDVAVSAVAPAPPGFDARAAAARTYRYLLWLGPVRPVRERAYVWHVRGEVDVDRLSDVARLFIGRRDWAACTPSAHLYRSCVRDVRAAAWRPLDAADCVPGADATVLAFEITAEGFLHNMVRVVVGTMVDVAQGRMTQDDVRAALAAGERRRMGRTAPAKGLALVGVDY